MEALIKACFSCMQALLAQKAKSRHMRNAALSTEDMWKFDNHYHV